jgi:5-methylcytosine-specific restriction endonuclease McrBC regulatory subunit McrC
MLLQEYGSPVRLEGDAQRLLRLIEDTNIYWQNQLGLRNTPLEVVPSEDGVVRVRARGVTGQVQIGKHDLHIAPKYLPSDEVKRWQESLFDILAFADTPAFRQSSFIRGRVESGGFIDLLAQSYADTLELALERGAPRGYKQSKELLGTSRGRLLTEELYPQALQNPSKLWFETDEFSKNIVLTRLLHWACDRFSDLVNDSAIRNDLLSVKQRFADVPAQKPPETTLDRYFLSPKHRHYEDAFNIAKWLAQHQGPNLATGQVEIPGVLLKSRTIYQGFVDSCLRHISNSNGWEYEDEPTRVLAFGVKTISTSPDHYLVTNGERILLDSKYKGKTEWTEKEEHSGTPLRNQDVYQIMAGSRVFDTSKAALIYPTIPESIEDAWQIEGEGLPRTLYTVQIDPVEFTHDSRDEFLSQVAGELQRIINYGEGESD